MIRDPRHTYWGCPPPTYTPCGFQGGIQQKHPKFVVFTGKNRYFFQILVVITTPFQVGVYFVVIFVIFITCMIKSTYVICMKTYILFSNKSRVATGGSLLGIDKAANSNTWTATSSTARPARDAFNSLAR